jgi:tetratricopeptide (TPR) repeat protein
LSFEFLKNLIENIKKLDVEVNDYKRVVQNPYIPSIAYVNWAIHLAESGDIEEAEKKLISSTLMAHQTPESYINLGVIKTRKGNLEEAKELYIKAIRLDHNNAKAYCFLGNVLTEMKDFKEAEKKFVYAAKLDPNNSDILLNWGISLVRQKKFLLASEKFQQACKSNGSNYTALYFLALVDLELGDVDKAKEKFKMIVSTVPNHYESYYYLAYIDFKEKKYEESLSYGLKSLEVFNKKPETYMIIAENYMHLKNEQECFKYYELGQNECRINYFFFISWGIALQKFGRYEESKEKFQKAIKLDDKNDIGFAHLGTSCYHLKDYDCAINFAQKTLDINPESIHALDILGQINFDRENYKESIKYFSQVLQNSAKEVENYGKIANAYFLDGDIEKANEYYQKAIQYQSEDMQIFIDYAKFLIEQKEYEQALKKLQTAYKFDDKNLDCLNLMFYVNYMLAKENISDYNIERAIEVAQIIEKNYPDSFIYREEKQELEAKSKK